MDKDTKNKETLKAEILKIEASIEKYQEMNNDLKKMIVSAETEHFKQKKEFTVVVNERDFLGQQLIKRNFEINSLYEKIKALQSELVKMHNQYKKILIDIEKQKSAREFLLNEFQKTESIIKNIFELKVIKIKHEKEVLITKNKVRSLEDETRKPLNIHRWTKLQCW